LARGHDALDPELSRQAVQSCAFGCDHTRPKRLFLVISAKSGGNSRGQEHQGVLGDLEGALVASTASHGCRGAWDCRVAIEALPGGGCSTWRSSPKVYGSSCNSRRVA